PCRGVGCHRAPPSPQVAPRGAGSVARSDGSPRSARPPPSTRVPPGRPAGCGPAPPGLPVPSATAPAPPVAPNRPDRPRTQSLAEVLPSAPAVTLTGLGLQPAP